jgi:hypothetical protein
MTDIKQEWIGRAETAVAAYMEKTYHARLNPTNASIAKAAVRAVAPMIRADALREAAKVAGWAHMVPPDGGSPTEDECRVAEAAEAHILALIDAPKKP